jgi:hypothetical protein
MKGPRSEALGTSIEPPFVAFQPLLLSSCTMDSENQVHENKAGKGSILQKASAL